MALPLRISRNLSAAAQQYFGVEAETRAAETNFSSATNRDVALIWVGSCFRGSDNGCYKMTRPLIEISAFSKFDHER